MAAHHSPEPSSAEEIEDDSTALSESQWQSQEPHETEQKPSASMENSPTPSAQQSKNPIPLQKRRRVTRACDECRRKKIKCDGKQPCTHCTVYSYECTYDQPSNRRRNPAPQYIEALENRLQKAEALLRTVLPDVDLDDPKFDAHPPQQLLSTLRQQSTHKTPSENTELKGNAAEESSDESLLESMVQNTGALDIDDEGHWDYHGDSSGVMFMRRMREQFGGLVVPDPRGLPLMKARPMSQFLESPKCASESPNDMILPHTHDLPSREVAQELCSNTLDDACALMRFMHKPSFYAMLDRIYDTPPDHFGNEENRFLPLLYVVLAVGCLFAKTENSRLDVNGYEGAIDQGFQYWKAGRQMIDITDCRDLTSLHTVCFMILFLQSSAKLSVCYSYIGIALRAALRLGLHRSVAANFTPIERELRKRTFWLIRKMDTYVSALLGLPQLLGEEDIDQELPAEIDDEFIQADAMLSMPPDRISMLSATNAHTRMLKILLKVVKYIYPLKGVENAANSKSDRAYLVSHAKIREIERDLQGWMEELPMMFRPSDDAPRDLARVQRLLRMSYAHVQMILYRPFLHYVAGKCQIRGVDKRSYACAAACVSVSRNIVHITAQMKKRGLLIGAYWFTMYTTYFAILSLVFFVLENPDSLTGKEIMKDAMEGKDTLASLAKRSMAADRCSRSLAGLFSELPEKLRGRKSSTPVTKKRAPPSPNPGPAHSTPEVTSAAGRNSYGGQQRASTFPNHVSAGDFKRASVPTDAAKPAVSVNENGVFRPNSQGGWTLGDTMGVMTPESMPSMAVSGEQMQSSPQQLSFGQQLSNANLPDLNAMMFPSADPFAYPNQPISTLEDGQFKQEQGQFGFPGTNNIYVPNETSNVCLENLAVPMFGSLPPYLIQQGRQVPTPMNDPSFSGPQVDAGMNADMVPVSSEQGFWQPTRNPGRTGMTPGMNLDEIFSGEDWIPSSGWMGTNYR